MGSVQPTGTVESSIAGAESGKQSTPQKTIGTVQIYASILILTFNKTKNKKHFQEYI